MTDVVLLTRAEADALADCEEKIATGLQTFVEVGTALATIRDNRLYRADHETFEAYCQDRWNIKRSYAYSLISAADVVSAIADTGLPAPANEGQARELGRIPEPERSDVWREVQDRTEGKPTAAAIAEVRREREQPQNSPTGADAFASSAATRPDRSGPTPGEVNGYEEPLGGTTSQPTSPGHTLPSSLTPELPQSAPPTERTAPTPDPALTDEDAAMRGSHTFAQSLASLFLALDPDPIRWAANRWRPDAFPNRDLPRVRDAFTNDGLRTLADHLYSLADHLESNGSSL